MADQQSPPHRGEGSIKMAQRHRLFRLQWTYLRGWLVIAALVVLAKLVAKIFSEAEEWLEPYLASPLSTAWKIALAVVILLIVPWALGKLTEVPLRLLRTSRSMQMFRRMERRLTRELRPDESRGYRIALIDFPTTEVRTLGVIGSTFREPETGRKLATVYLPGTPDPTKGSLMVVALDHLALTDWTLQDIIGCHVTFGSGSPAS